MSMVHDTAQGIKELCHLHGFNWVIFLGIWEAGFVKFLTSIDVVVLVIVVLITCIGMISLQTPACLQV